MLNLDTHMLLFAVAGILDARERRLLSGERWSVSAIVLWEVATLAQLGRIAVDLEDADVIKVLGRRGTGRSGARSVCRFPHEALVGAAHAPVLAGVDPRGKPCASPAAS